MRMLPKKPAIASVAVEQHHKGCFAAQDWQEFCLPGGCAWDAMRARTLRWLPSAAERSRVLPSAAECYRALPSEHAAGPAHSAALSSQGREAQALITQGWATSLRHSR